MFIKGLEIKDEILDLGSRFQVYNGTLFSWYLDIDMCIIPSCKGKFYCKEVYLKVLFIYR